MNTTKSAQVGNVRGTCHIIGDKWTPQLLRFFMNNESLRFCQLEKLVPDINPRTLSARLTMLENEEIITKMNQPESTRSEYTLTDKGRELEPVLRAMQAWGARYHDEQ